MKKVSICSSLKISGGELTTSQRAGFACGFAIGASLLGGVLTGGAALIPMLAGAAGPICGASIYSMY